MDTEPVPDLHVYLADGVSTRRWAVTCRTCGWHIEGTGDTGPRDEAAKAHRCEVCAQAHGRSRPAPPAA